MRWKYDILSNAALRYAVDICQEKEKYRVGIASLDADKLEAMRELLPTLIVDRNCIESIINTKNEFRICFTNGSTIMFISSSSNACGQRLHLLIADRDTPFDIMNNILRPCENLEWMNYMFEQEPIKIKF